MPLPKTCNAGLIMHDLTKTCPQRHQFILDRTFKTVSGRPRRGLPHICLCSRSFYFFYALCSTRSVEASS